MHAHLLKDVTSKDPGVGAKSLKNLISGNSN